MAVFNATPGNGGTSPSFQWQVNGLNAGTNSPTFTSTSIPNGAQVTCILTSNNSCANGPIAISSAINMSVTSLLVPSVSIGISNGTNPLCAGAPVTVTASPVFGGSSPLFFWQVNGQAVSSQSAATVSFSNAAVISCTLVSGLSCASPSTATSNAITFTTYPVPPAPTITALSSTTFCAGGSVTLNTGSSQGILWNNGSSGASIIVTGTGTFAAGQTLNGCSSPSSSPVSVLVHPLPTVSLATAGTLCIGDGPITLTSGAPAGGTYSGAGVSGVLFSPSLSGAGNFVLSYQYSDANNCTNTASTAIVVDACLGFGQTLNKDASLHVFPNPGQGIIFITSDREKILSVRLTDVNGKVVLRQGYLEEIKIMLDISRELPGIYVLEVRLNGGLSFYSRIIKKD